MSKPNGWGSLFEDALLVLMASGLIIALVTMIAKLRGH